MSRYAALSKRIHALLHTIQQPRLPRAWVMALEEGEEVSPSLLKHLQPDDTLRIEHYPAGYFDVPTAQSMSCWLGKWQPCVVIEESST